MTTEYIPYFQGLSPPSISLCYIHFIAHNTYFNPFYKRAIQNVWLSHCERQFYMIFVRVIDKLGVCFLFLSALVGQYNHIAMRVEVIVYLLAIFFRIDKVYTSNVNSYAITLNIRNDVYAISPHIPKGAWLFFFTRIHSKHINIYQRHTCGLSLRSSIMI